MYTIYIFLFPDQILLNLFYFIKTWNPKFLIWLFLTYSWSSMFPELHSARISHFPWPAWVESSHLIKVSSKYFLEAPECIQQCHPHQILDEESLFRGVLSASTPNLKCTEKAPTHLVEWAILTCSWRCYSFLLALLELSWRWVPNWENSFLSFVFLLEKEMILGPGVIYLLSNTSPHSNSHVNSSVTEMSRSSSSCLA